MGRLAGKVAVVLGAAGQDNMGQVMARRFAEEGATVVVAGRRSEPLEALALLFRFLAELPDAHPSFFHFRVGLEHEHAEIQSIPKELEEVGLQLRRGRIAVEVVHADSSGGDTLRDRDTDKHYWSSQAPVGPAVTADRLIDTGSAGAWALRSSAWAWPKAWVSQEALSGRRAPQS